MKIISVVGARPNFMKIAAFAAAIKTHNLNGLTPYIHHKIIHTGQHYDERMTDVFFKALSIPEPDMNLQIGSGTHAEQVGYTMIAFEKVLLEEKPDWVVVPGDVNATLACALAAAKLQIKVCHIEAGLRSFDHSMPEEINRILTDRISSLLLTPDKIAGENLLLEGTSKSKIRFVGNIMIDTLKQHINEANNLDLPWIIENNSINKVSQLHDKFILLTLHRPSNVDDYEALERITNWSIRKSGKDFSVIWVLHPRTENKLKELNLWDRLQVSDGIKLLQALNYHEMLKLSSSAHLIVTDSGGLQEEATVLGKPCIVLRPNTERPATLVENGGTCLLTGNDEIKMNDAFDYFLSENIGSVIPEKWDGKTAERCVEAIVSYNTNVIHA
jgi:UDP-N-acetylglucosamine 2-epimerase (non-hydrolysing)